MQTRRRRTSTGGSSSGSGSRSSSPARNGCRPSGPTSNGLGHHDDQAAAAHDAATTPGGARRSARLLSQQQAKATSTTAPSSSSSNGARKGGKQQQQPQAQSGGGGGSILQSGYFYMALLALQFGCQPMLARAFIPRGLPKMPVVIATEGVKILLCLAFLSCERAAERKRVWKTWSLWESLRVGLLPAALYALQNTMAQIGYQNLDSLTFNLLNQTKTLAAAVCLYLVIGRRQTPLQMVALALLLSASIMLNLPKGTKSGAAGSSSLDMASLEATTFYLGVVPVLLASLTSGICAALTQKTLQGLSRNPYLYSMELAVYGQLCLAATMLLKALYVHHFTDQDAAAVVASLADPNALQGWTRYTWVPIVTNAFGGVVVGLVTKHAGGVKKGFALIAGIALTAFVQAVVQATPPPPLHWVAAALVALSTYMHSAYGPAPATKPPAAAAGAAKTANSSKKRQ